MIHRWSLGPSLVLLGLCSVVSGQVVVNPPFVNGGAVAIGHPIGATGGRLMATVGLRPPVRG